MLETGPISSDVAGIPNRQAKPVRCRPHDVADLEGGAFLAFDAVGVERVDQADGLLLGDLHDQAEGVVKGTLHLDDLGPVGERAGQLPGGHFAFRDQHHRAHAGAGCISCSRGGGVAGGGADDGFGVPPGCLTDGGSHAAILERAGRIQSFKFHKKLEPAAQLLCQFFRRDERRISLQQGDRTGMRRKIEQALITMQNALIG